MKRQGKRWEIGLVPMYMVLSGLLALIFLAGCAVIQYLYTQEKISAYAAEANETSLRQISKRLDTEIHAATQYVANLLGNAELKSLLVQAQDIELPYYQRQTAIQSITRYLSQNSLAFPESAQLILVTSKRLYGLDYTGNRSAEIYYALFDQDPEVQETLAQSPGGVGFFPKGDLSGKPDMDTQFVGCLTLPDGAKGYIALQMRSQWLDDLLYIEEADSFLDSRAGFFYPPQAAGLQSAVIDRLTEESGSFLERIGRENYSITYRPLESAPFTLVFSQNTTSLYQPLNRIRFYAALSISASVLFSAVFFRTYTRRKIADLQQLRDAAREYINSGKGSLLTLKYRSRSLHEDTTVSFFLIVALPLLIFESAFYLTSAWTLDNSARELSMVSLARKVGSFDALIDRNSRISGNIMFDQTVQDILKAAGKGENWEKSGLEAVIGPNVRDPGLQSLDLYDAEGKLLYSTRLNDSDAEWELSEAARNSFGEVFFLEEASDSSRIKLTRKIRNVYTAAPYERMVTLGYIICTYSDSGLSAILGDASNSRNSFYILDAAGEICYSYTGRSGEGAELARQNGEYPKRIRGEDGQWYWIFSQPFARTDWTSVSVIPERQLRQDTPQLLSLNINMLLASWILILISARFLANYIAQPVRRLIEHIIEADSKADSGDAGRYYPHELNELTYAFNDMLRQVQRVYDLESERSRAELKALQSQINPHFMYNTFESIRWMSRAGDQERVDQMIGYLNDLFRLGISADKDWLLFREEVQYADAYLSIQKMRYEDQLHYRWEIDPETEEFLLPKLVLQPLLENAIYHGIRELEEENGLIIIRSRMEKGRLVIDITDNGPGFTPEEREHQLRLFRHPEENRAGSIGLNNVYRRLDIYYGEHFSMDIYSEPYVNTTIHLELPASECRKTSAEQNASSNQ